MIPKKREMQMIDTVAAMAVLDSEVGPALAGSAVLVGERLGRAALDVLVTVVDVIRTEVVGTE